MLYKITKASRGPDAAPYVGITCDEAGVPHGKIYYNKAEAIADAEKMSECNPVGFEVHSLVFEEQNDVR